MNELSTFVKAPDGGVACPYEESPQQTTAESDERTPQLCQWPAETSENSVAGGVAWPIWLLPQQLTYPSLLIAQTVFQPDVTFV